MCGFLCKQWNNHSNWTQLRNLVRIIERARSALGKTLWIQFGWKIGIKVLSFTRSSSSIKLQQLKIEYGINHLGVVRLVDNVRCDSWWSRFAIGLICARRFGCSLGIQDCSISWRINREESKDSAGRSLQGVARVGSLESEGEDSFVDWGFA